MGVLQGAAEVVPVSSSAQLSLVPLLLGWPPADDRNGFAAGLHAGSCLGVAWSLRSELRALDRRTAGQLALATVPAAVAGWLVRDGVEPGPRGTALLLGGAGLLLWAADRRPQDRPAGGRELAWAGVAQVAALAPGVSRAGATLTALRLCRVPRAQAVRTSMLLSLPVTAGAATVSCLRVRPATEVLVGAPVAAFIAAALGARARASRSLLSGSALYRLALAGAVLRRLRRGVTT